MLNVIKNVDFNRVTFDTNSFPIVIDSGASSSAAPFKTDYIARTYKVLDRVVISGIASGLEAKGIGSVIYKIKDDDGIPIDLQIDKVLHLENLPTRILSPQQLLKQHHSIGDNYFINSQHSTLKLGGYTKTIEYDPLSNLPLLYTESGINKIYNLIQDGNKNENLAAAQ